MFYKIKMAFYSLFLVNLLGLKVKLNIISINEARNQLTKKLFNILNIKIIVRNIENFKNIDSTIILASNHRSVIDPLIIHEAIKESNINLGYWLAKEDLYKSFFFGLFTKNTGTILVPNDKKESINFMKEIKERLLKENSIFIFPEGTRNKTDNNIIKFEKGVSLISIKNKTNILPIYIETKAEKILKNALNKKQSTIIINIGKIINYKESKNIEDIYKKEFRLYN